MKYVLTFIGGGMPETPAEIQESEAAWGAWYGQLGASVVDAGNPTSVSKTIAPDGTVTDGSDVTGYTLISADNLDAATEMAKLCPIFNSGGGIVVSQAIDM